jgi:tetratricopeptide (TPR) repeat protein
MERLSDSTELVKDIIQNVIFPAIAKFIEKKEEEKEEEGKHSSSLSVVVTEDIVLHGGEILLKKALGSMLGEFDPKSRQIILRLDNLSEGIKALRTTFYNSMNDVIWKLEWQSQTLADIRTIVSEPFQTQANALYRRAERSYSRGLPDKALEDLLLAAKLDYENVAVYKTLGNFFYYDRHDLPIALDYFQQAAESASDVHHDAKKAAECHLLAAHVCSDMEDRLEKAIVECEKALQLNPDLPYAHYDLAKYKAKAGDGKGAATALEYAIRADTYYYEQAEADPDLKDVLEVQNLLTHLGNDATQVVEELKSRCTYWLNNFVLPGDLVSNLQQMFNELEQATTYMELTAVAPHARANLDTIHKRHETSFSVAFTLKQRIDGLRLLAFLPDGKTLVSIGGNLLVAREVKFWDVQTGKLRWMLKLNHSPESIAFSPNGAIMATGYYNGELELLFTRTGKRIRGLKVRAAADIFSMAFSPDGKTLATGSGDPVLPIPSEVKLWDIQTGKQLKWNQKENRNEMLLVAFSPDGQTLVTVGRRGMISQVSEIKFWNLQTGKLKRRSKEFRGGIHSIAFSSDGRMLVSAGKNGELKLWNIMTGKLEWTSKLKKEGMPISIAFTLDSRMLAVGNSDGTVQAWQRGFPGKLS